MWSPRFGIGHAFFFSTDLGTGPMAIDKSNRRFDRFPVFRLWVHQKHAKTCPKYYQGQESEGESCVCLDDRTGDQVDFLGFSEKSAKAVCALVAHLYGDELSTESTIGSSVA